MTDRRCPVWVPALVLLLTVAQLAVAEWVPGIDRFARLVRSGRDWSPTRC